MVATTPAVAQTVTEYGLDSQRYWPVTTAFADNPVRVDHSVDGTTLVVVVDDADPVGDDLACRVAVAGDDGAVAYSYRHDFQPTRCTDAAAHPDGGFLIRGEAISDSEQFDLGFTTRVDVAGEIVWAVDDDQLLDEQPRPEGPGQFRGDYDKPLPGIAYDSTDDVVMVLSRGIETLAGDVELTVTQAHLFDADTGEPRRVGQTFGPIDTEVIEGVVARDGEFLVQTDHDSEGSRFYSMGTDHSIEVFVPDDGDWSHRDAVAPSAYRSQVGTIYVWTEDHPDDPDGLQVGVARVEGLDSVVWSRRFDPEQLYDPHDEIPLQPVGVVTDDHTVAIIYGGRLPIDQFVHLVAVDDGTSLGVSPWWWAMEYEPVGLIRDREGTLQAVGLDRNNAVIGEYRFDADTTVDTRAPNSGDGDNGGCRHTGTAPVSPVVAALVVLGLVRISRPPVLA